MLLITTKNKSKIEALMHHKNIKYEVITQLKNEFPNWIRLPNVIKKEISRKVLEEVTVDYDFKHDIAIPDEDLLGINNQLPVSGIINLDKMAEYINEITCSRIIKFSNYDRSAIYIKNEELQFIDQLIDDTIINNLLSNDSYSPSMREIFPSHLFRAELLKALKYPEISYRKFCDDEYLSLDRQENRVFIGLPLHKNTTIDHTQLSRFRTNMTFKQQINLLIYFLHLFYKSDLLGDCTLCAVDSTELANDCKVPLASMTIKGKKIRIYGDLDCDCGTRRNKRDKSIYVIGYRLHTLTVIDVQSRQSFPLVSILAPANHHDSKFLPFLVKLAQAMGIDVNLITADEAYHDKDGSLFEETGVIVITPPSSTVQPPENIDVETGAVFCNDECSIMMEYLGSENLEHEYKCGAEPRQCLHSETCSQCRIIQMDQGLFQRIPFASIDIEEAHDIRKNCERPFNLLKHQVGLEKIRVRSQQATMSRCTLSTIAVLLIKMAGQRKKKKTIKEPQHLLNLAVNM